MVTPEPMMETVSFHVALIVFELPKIVSLLLDAIFTISFNGLSP